jgi:predicted protein tyrosine phosphatase
MNHTDTKLLQILLSLPSERLSSSEKRAFQAMFDDLSNGKIVGLSKKQKAWANEVYVKNDLHKKPLPRLKKITVKDKSAVKVLDFGPLPMKPPGR